MTASYTCRFFCAFQMDALRSVSPTAREHIGIEKRENEIVSSALTTKALTRATSNINAASLSSPIRSLNLTAFIGSNLPTRRHYFRVARHLDAISGMRYTRAKLTRENLHLATMSSAQH